MASIIWCDRIKHEVVESRSEVARLIYDAQANSIQACAMGENQDPDPKLFPLGYIYVTLVDHQGVEPTRQRALNVGMISSFEAVEGDPI